jgi:enamine deaminase RidA (YjgF/YER057c/UK114 family)
MFTSVTAQGGMERDSDGECVVVETPYARELYVRIAVPCAGPITGCADGLAGRLYDRLRLCLQRWGADLWHVTSEVAYVRNLATDRPAVLQRRKLMYRDLGAKPPLACIEQPPCTPGRAYELQACAIVPSDCRTRIAIRNERDDGVAVSMVDMAGVRRIHVGGIVVGLSALGEEAGFADRNPFIFNRAEQLLSACGATFHAVVRTWYYLRDIDRHYATLNRARSAYFRHIGLPRIPASTGVGAGLGSRGTLLDLDLLALVGVRPDCIVRLRSPALNEAAEYGAMFARGVRVALPEKTLVLISGTASIDARGVSLHVGDAVNQSRRMLENVECLLRAAHATWTDIVQATVYLKSVTDFPALAFALHERGLQSLPYCAVRADLCRSELLCEMEAVAVLPAANGGIRDGNATGRTSTSMQMRRCRD